MIGEAVRNARLRKGLSQQDLANRAGITRQYLSAVERGANVSIRVVERLATVLELLEIPITKTVKLVPGVGSSAGADILTQQLDRITEAASQARRILDESASDRTEPASQTSSENTADVPTGLTKDVIRTILNVNNPIGDASPLHGLQLTSMAIELAERVPGVAPEALNDLLGLAWKEHAIPLWRLGRFQEGLEALDEAERRWSTTNANEVNLAHIEYLRGAIRFEMRHLDQAYVHFRRASNVYETFGENKKLVAAWLLEGAILFRMGRYLAARDVWLRAEKKASSMNDAENLSVAHNNLGACFRELGDFDKAEIHLRQALDLEKSLGHEVDAVRTRWNLALLHVARGEFDQGGSQLREVRGEFERLGMVTDGALVALDSVDVLLALGKKDEVQAECGRLVRVFAHYEMNAAALTALGFLREAVARNGVTPEVVKKVRSALKEQPPAADPPLNPKLRRDPLPSIPVSNVRAEVHLAAGLISQAEGVLHGKGSEKINNLSPEVNLENPLTADSISRLVDVAYDAMEVSPLRSLELLDAASALTAEIIPRLPPDLAASLRARLEKERANALLFMSRYPEALTALDAAEAYISEAETPPFTHAETTYIRGKILSELGHQEEALACAWEALAEFTRMGKTAKVMNARCLEAAVYFRAGRFREAAAIFKDLGEEAERTNDRYRSSLFLKDLGVCLWRLNQLEEAKHYISLAIPIAEELGHQTTLVKARWTLAMIGAAQGEYDKALTDLRGVSLSMRELGMEVDSGVVVLDMIEILSATRRFEEIAPLCEGLVESFVAQGMTKEALTAVGLLREAARAKTLAPALVTKVRSFLQDKTLHAESPPPPQ